MEIEFNPSRPSQSGYLEPVSRPAPAAAAAAPQVVQSTASLESQLQGGPSVSPEKIAQARALLADEKYPPEDVLDRIAVLLAVQMSP